MRERERKEKGDREERGDVRQLRRHDEMHRCVTKYFFDSSEATHNHTTTSLFSETLTRQ